jgi:hypothetical protein
VGQDPGVPALSSPEVSQLIGDNEKDRERIHVDPVRLKYKAANQ